MKPWHFPSDVLILFALSCHLLGLTLTCVVLHHVLVVSVGGLGEVHAHALDPLDAPHGRVPPCPKQGQLGLWVHITAGCPRVAQA